MKLSEKLSLMAEQTRLDAYPSLQDVLWRRQNEAFELEASNKDMKQAILNTLDTGMDRYIREVLNEDG